MKPLSFIPFSQTKMINPLIRSFLKDEWNHLATPFNEDLFEDSQYFPAFSVAQRTALVSALQQQYQDLNLETPEIVASFKDENTYCVTTGHQLCLFTGPSYVIYKIACCIATAKRLSQRYPDKQFVPVFWMATEDHDFEEIASVNVFGKTIQWERERAGAVGRFNLDGLQEAFQELSDLLGERGLGLLEKLKHTFNQKNLSDHFRGLVHELFSDFTELVVLDADDSELKASFSSVLIKESFEQVAQPQIEKTSQELKEAGYKLQVTPRPINLFYIEGHLRERIVRNGDRFEVLNTDLSFSASQWKELIETHPERISPNVVMRPVYQQFILPNVAYIGGGGELSYWLQLRTVFREFGVHYPLLKLRDSFLFLREKQWDQWLEMGFGPEHLFHSAEGLKKTYLHTHGGTFSLQKEQEQLEKTFAAIGDRMKTLDASLTGSVQAELAKLKKSIGQLEGKAVKAQKRKEEVYMNRIDKTLEAVFPEGTFQERIASIWSVWSRQPEVIRELVELMEEEGRSGLTVLPA